VLNINKINIATDAQNTEISAVLRGFLLLSIPFEGCIISSPAFMNGLNINNNY
jgi:hypothetical protein